MGGIVGLGLFLLGLSMGGGVQAAAAGECVSASEMREIANHFTQFEDLARNGEYCLDGSQTSHLIAGILFMRKTRFAEDMPASRDELFSGSFKNDWYQYFIGRITDFEIEAECPKGVIAYVYFWGTTMYVCPTALTDNFTALDRASVFMHEARHIDGFPHTTCTHGPRAGMAGACDDRISDKGSYAVTVETYSQIAKYAGDVHPALRAYARSAAVTYADEAFQTEVHVERRSQFLLLTSDRRFHSLTFGDSSAPSVMDLGTAPGTGRIALRGQHMILFPEDRTQKARFVYARGEGENSQGAGDIAAEYNGQTPGQRAELVDVHIAAQWSARVYRDKVRLACDRDSESYSDLPFSGTPSALLYPAGYDRGASSVVLSDDQGRLFDVGCEGNRGYVRPSLEVLDQPYRRVYKSGADILGLTSDGRLHRLLSRGSEAVSSPLDGQVLEIIPEQVVEFLDSEI